MGKRRTMSGVLAGAAAVAAAMTALPTGAQAAPAAPCGARAEACVDLSANTAWLMRGGVVTYGGVPISSGMPGYETPPGTFSVTYKDIDHWSRAYDAPMPYSVFFTRSGIAFHAGSLSEQSHGCVRLSTKAARTFYNTLRPGDTVQVVP